jgi:polyhydroxyalkanoate synthesis repressor PhaR
MTDAYGPAPESTSTSAGTVRIIKRYSNRKLYDTVESRYVTLPQIAVLVRNGEDVRIVDNNSKEDLTSVTLAQIVYEEERKQSRALPLATLKDLIHTSGEKLNQFFREGRMAKILRKDSEVAEGSDTHEGETDSTALNAVDAASGSTTSTSTASDTASKEAREAKEATRTFERTMEQARASWTEFTHMVDDRAKRVTETLYPAAQLEKLTAELKKLTQRVEELEKKLENHDAA